MNGSTGKGRNDSMTPELWRGSHEHLRATKPPIERLTRRMRERCKTFSSTHPIGQVVESRDLFSAVYLKRISYPFSASDREVALFLKENSLDSAIEYMACWATSRRPLLGVAQKLAGRRPEQPGATEMVLEIADPHEGRATDRPVRVSEQTRYLDAYEREICDHLGEHDYEARLALRQLKRLLAQNGLDLSDEPETKIGQFTELPFGAIRDLVNEEGEELRWQYETARKACARLATADRAVREEAERAGFGTGAEALLGYLRLRIKTQSPGGGGNVTPPVGEETKS